MTVTDLHARFGPRLGPYASLADLNDAIACGLNDLSLTLSSPPSVLDADLVAVSEADYNQFDDLILLRCYETILLNLTDDLLREAGISVVAADVRAMFERRISKLEDRLRDRYGFGRGSISGGAADYGFAQTDPCDVTPLWGY